jgi:Domain of unknown function (DUF4129)
VSGARRLLWSGIALMALLALVAVASRAHRPGGGSGAQTAHAPAVIGDYLATIALIAVPIGSLFVLWGLTQSRRLSALEGKTNWRRTLVTFVVLSLLLAAGVFLVDRHGGLRLFGRNGQNTTPASTTSASIRPKKGRHPHVVPPRRANFRWLPVLVLGSLALGLIGSIGAAAVLRRREGDAVDEEAALAAALKDVLADSLDDLRAERDPRRAVIRTYARMEKTFAAYGVPRERAEAPLEYLARVLDSLRVSAYSVRRLTQLFERAKFSPHEVDAGMKDEAIDALAGLRAELEHREAALLMVLATIAYAVARLGEPGRRALWLDVYLLVLGAIAVFAAVLATREAFPLDRGSALAAALEREPRDALRPHELERLEREVTLGTSTAFDLHYRLRPILREVAEQRLADRHGLRLDRGGREVEAALGEELWELVRPERKPPEKRWAPGLEDEAVRRVVERLEAL